MDAPDHVLVVDDDARLRSLLQRYLTGQGYMVGVAGDAAEAKRKLAGFDFDLIVLDVMMPGQDGVSLTRELRATRAVPILLLTARGEPRDRIAGLEAGADDYLVKPFEPRELLLRIATILRRARGEARAPRAPIVRFGPYQFDRDQLLLTRDDGSAVHLTSGELSLLKALAERPGETVARAELGQLSTINGSDRAVDVQMLRLRRKLEDDASQPRYILTVRGEGYALRTGR